MFLFQTHKINPYISPLHRILGLKKNIHHVILRSVHPHWKIIYRSKQISQTMLLAIYDHYPITSYPHYIHNFPLIALAVSTLNIIPNYIMISLAIVLFRLGVQTTNTNKTYQNISHIWRFPEMGLPLNNLFIIGFSMKETIHLWFFPHWLKTPISIYHI